MAAWKMYAQDEKSVQQIRRGAGNGHHARNLRRDNHDVTFMAVDGEGTGDGSDHRYVLLRAGTGEALENAKGIRWWQAFDYLYSHYRPDVAYVGYFLGYDFTQILKTLPWDRVAALLKEDDKTYKLRQRTRSKSRIPFPVEIKAPDGKRWQVDILGMKRLKLRPKFCDCLNQECIHQSGC